MDRYNQMQLAKAVCVMHEAQPDLIVLETRLERWRAQKARQMYIKLLHRYALTDRFRIGIREKANSFYVVLVPVKED